MARNSKDPTLTALAKQFDSVNFVDPLSEAEVKHYIKLGQDSQLKNVWWFAGKAYRAVRLFIGGEYRVIAYLHGSGDKAARIADMAVLRFASRRLRYADKNPKLNFSIERATKDLQNEMAIVKCLNEVDEHFQSIGAFVQPVEAEIKQSAKDRIAQLETEIKKLNEKIDQLLLRPVYIPQSPVIVQPGIYPQPYNPPWTYPVITCGNSNAAGVNVLDTKIIG